MKLRLSKNSIRLRLSRTDVKRLSEDLLVEESVSFGKKILGYELIASETIKELSAEFTESKITVFIPYNFTKDWFENEVVGIESVIRINDLDELHILVEKDFKCIEQTNEDQSDNYNNPNTTC